MHNHIVESIGKWGVVTTPSQCRINRVRPGDIIRVPEQLRRYPCDHEFSRIATIDKYGMANVCEDMGSAFLNQDGSCDISGGPWWGIPISLLKPAYELHQATYWNWGGNCAGAAQGVYYNIFRPLHDLTVHPYDIKRRYAIWEQDARKGTFLNDDPLSESEWSLFFKSDEPESGGEYLFIFRKAQ